ncbi:tetratricopeptide repeat protein [Chitinibacter fontanus]|uniref:Tetratricopeptide repeat protein n=1 Tax=Chitinibacter fontanus TaxID=1737446 RepID=A0A7D5ZFD7_9NEIS|nr:tetratricopeptide repeat protein [Chitinibacter fontanus]QLI82606.1 tetratricopeptide repeat protein [Chitinibacter fontanus]
MKKPIFVVPVLLSSLLLAGLATPAQASWLGDEWRNFRTYPRLNKAYELYRKNDLAGARPLVEEVVRIDPKAREARILLSQICSRLGDATCLDQQGVQWTHLRPNDALGPYLQAYAAYLQQNWTIVPAYASAALARSGLTATQQQRGARAWVTSLLHEQRKTEAQQAIRLLQAKQVPIAASDLQNWQQQLAEEPTATEDVPTVAVAEIAPPISSAKQKKTSSSTQTKNKVAVKKASDQTAVSPPKSPEFPYRELSEAERQAELSALFASFIRQARYQELELSVQALQDAQLYTPAIEQQLANHLSGKHCAELLKLVSVSSNAKTTSSHSQLAAAYCAQQENDPALAAQYYVSAQKIARELGKPVPLDWVREEADARLAAGELEDALELYDQVNQRAPNPALAKHIAGLALAHPELPYSPALLARYAAALPPGEVPLSHARKLMQQQNWSGASAAYQQALAENEQADSWYELAQAYRHLNQTAEQGAALAKAAQLSPNNAQFQAEYGYWLQQSKQIAPALGALNTAYQLEPARKELLPDLAQLASDDGQRTVAAQYWRQSIDSAATIAERLSYDTDTAAEREFGWQRGVQTHEDRWNFILGGQWRLDNQPTSQIMTSPVQYAQYNSQLTASAAYRLDPIWDNAHPTYVFGRVTTGLEDYSLKPLRQGWMTGLGLSQRLSKDYNLLGSVEWLHHEYGKLNDDVMLRLSGSHSIGTDWNAVDNAWTMLNIYGDYAWLVRDRNYYFTTKAEAGRHYKTPELGSKTTLEPYLNTIFTMNNANDEDTTVSRWDIGLGVALNLWHGGDQWRAPDWNQRLSLEVRQVIGGNTKERHSIMFNWQLVH